MLSATAFTRNSVLSPIEPVLRSQLKVAVAGMGAIGSKLVRSLADGDVPGIALVGVAVRDRAKGQVMLDAMSVLAPIHDLKHLPDIADIIIECLPAAAFESAVQPALAAGKKVIVLSVGALLSHAHLIELARVKGGQIIVPTGALLGLDAVCAAAEGQIHSVHMVTRKPIAGLLGAPYLTQNGINISQVKEPLRVFKGTAREAAIGFPANLNVAVALSLAGIGPERTMLEIWADPTVTRNTHRIVLNSDSALFDMTIENIPSDNPKTGRITALSVISTLRKLTSALRVGS